jgi:ectoine hydroxylase-related dioxygenase (phytanoyl-CoA dioxygenase family)
MSDVTAFAPDDLDGIEQHYREHGFVALRGLCSEDLMRRMEAECVAAQSAVVAGTLDPRYGSTRFLDEESKAERFANYVEHVQELSPAVVEAIEDPALQAVLRRLLGPDPWLRDGLSGVVYQDARPGRESGYTRIGWHSDWQSSPSMDIWPSTAFTFHLDGTGPDNGFLRAVPGSHSWATPAPFRNVNGVEVPTSAAASGGYRDDPPPYDMPLGFGKVPGEVALYLEAGDVLLHDAYLWHSAARATDDDTSRRHVRGGFFTGAGPGQSAPEEFLKNAAR